MTPARAAPFALPLMLAACANVPTTSIAPVEPLRFVDAELLVRPAVRGLEPPPFLPILDEEAAAFPRRVSIHARFLVLDPAMAEQLLGVQASSLLSIVVPREHGERLLADLEREQPDFELASEMELEMHERQEGCLSVLDQRAFVSSYTVRSSGQTALADPQVDVAMQGSLLVASGTLDDSGEHVTLDLRLDTCRLDESFAKLEFALVGANVQIQQPRGLIQSLSTRVNLGREEALLIGGATLSTLGPQGALFVLVEAEECTTALPAGPAD